MEIIAKRNEHFNLAATFLLGGNEVIRPKIALLPKGLFKNSGSFESVCANDELISQIKMMKVEAKTIEELKSLLDQEESRLIEHFEKKLEGVGA